MNTVSQITITGEPATEREQFWKEHAKLQRQSGLSRKAYCLKHQLNYDQFGYWESKWRQQKVVSRLLPVHLNRPVKTSDIPRPETICTLVFKNGHELKVHDQSILPMLCSIWS